MATNKNATIRYNALDKCFRNSGRNYCMADLVEVCNEALFSFNSKTQGVQKRQVYDDIRFMESEQGWTIPLIKTKNGRKMFYRYEDTDFSISKNTLSENEANQLRESIATLTRFKGLPQFEWIEEIQARLDSAFLLSEEVNVISFEDNPYLTGREHIGFLYNSIINHKCIKVNYQPFNRTDSISMLLHPYFIKQYNNRWFLFGYNTERDQITNVALDRIVDLVHTDIAYVPNCDIDFTEYFDDLVGVSIPLPMKVEKVLLRVDKKQWPYIKTKPIHGSQKIKEKTNEFTIIELELIINYEFESLLLSFGETISILSPTWLRDKFNRRISSMIKNYL